jgi:hypothetical protein
MEIKVVYYPRRQHYVILFKSPKAMKWGRIRANKEVLYFDDEESAIKMAKLCVVKYEENENAVTVWRNK